MNRIVTTLLFFLLATVALWGVFWPDLETAVGVESIGGMPFSMWLMFLAVLFIFTGIAIATTIGTALRKKRDNAGQEALKKLTTNSVLSYEHVERLTENDRSVLQREFLLLAITLGVFSMLPIVLLFIIEKADHGFIYAFMFPWLGLLGYFGLKGYEKKKKVLAADTKNVIRGIITDRFYKLHNEKGIHIKMKDRSTVSIPHLRIGDRELWVSHRIFRRYKIGDAVELNYCEVGFAYSTPVNVFLSHRLIEGASLVKARA